MQEPLPIRNRPVRRLPFDALPDDAAGLDPDFDEWDDADVAREGSHDLANVLRGWGREN